jgi:LacI family transcriptional regulator
MRRVALIYDAKLPYDLKVISGVALYMQEGADFITYIEEDALKDQKLPDLRSGRVDGIIADFDDPGVADAVLRSKLPAVGFGGGYGWYSQDSGIPYFFNDQRMIGEMAADHLLERGFRSFGYCGYVRNPQNLWNGERQQSFAARVASRGFPCSVYRPLHRTTRQWDFVLASLGSWLRSLPKPVGVMGANDRRARHVLEACRAYQLRVPGEVAVIGVDNDETLCLLSTPALTSIEQDAKRIGHEAAALLDRMMRGRKARQRHIVVNPVGVVTRKSTDVFAIEDSVVVDGIAFIRSNAYAGIKAADVVKALAFSRSGLESRFKATMGHTIHEVIRKVQLDSARDMISATNLAIKQVAANTGFKSVQHMTSLFGKAFGLTPARYRKRLMSQR